MTTSTISALLHPRRHAGEWFWVAAVLAGSAAIGLYFAWAELRLAERTEAARQAEHAGIVQQGARRQLAALQGGFMGVRGAMASGPATLQAAMRTLRGAVPGVRAVLVLDRRGAVRYADGRHGRRSIKPHLQADSGVAMRDPARLYVLPPDRDDPDGHPAMLAPLPGGGALAALLQDDFFGAALSDGARRPTLSITDPALDGPLVLALDRVTPAARQASRRPMVLYGAAWLSLALGSVAMLYTVRRRRQAWRRASERHQAERAADAARIEMALEGGGMGLWEWDVAASRFRLDPRGAALTGHAAGETRQDTYLSRWSQDVHPDDLARVQRDLDRHLAGAEPTFEAEYRQRHVDGGWVWILSRGKVLERDPQGRPLRLLGTRQDIGARKQAEAEIRHLAFYDSLTELPNRRLLHERLGVAIGNAVRLRRSGAVLFVDLDDFKNLNDTRGHDTGDRLLQQVAARLRSVTREGDTVARLGGDEFVILLEGLDENDGQAEARAGAVASKILLVLCAPYVIGRHEAHITPSIGVTVFGVHAQSVEDLLKQADLAMYDAKAAGRNTFRFFAPLMQETLDEHARIEADLRHAITRGQLRLHFQPIVDGAGDAVCFEALVRWQHPERGMVSPAQFIPVAEKSGLILGIGHWVLEHACAQLAAWPAGPDGKGVQVAVNVSSRQFCQEGFIAQVLEALEASGADPRRLKLELTESVVLHDVEDVIAKMSVLKQYGVSFALDDFGTGYSSLSYLRRLPLDQLKIDKSFVADMLVSENAATIVGAIVNLAGSLGMDVVAEGVETEAQRAWLERCGCRRYQGYLITRPLPAEQLRFHWPWAQDVPPRLDFRN